MVSHSDTAESVDPEVLLSDTLDSLSNESI